MEYNRIRVSILGYIKNTKTPFNLDIGIGDAAVPPLSKMSLPVLLNDFEQLNVLMEGCFMANNEALNVNIFKNMVK